MARRVVSKPEANRGALRSEAAALLKLGPPFILASIGTTLMTSVDVWMVSPLGKTALGAVAIGGSWATIVTMFSMALLSPMDAMVAQALGAKERAPVGAILRGGLGVAILTALPAVLLLLFPGPAIRLLLGSGATDDLVDLAVAFCRPLAIGLPGFLVYAAVRDFIVGHERPWPDLWVVLGANVVNLAGDWALIGGHLGLPALGVRGCAWSTAASQTAMLAAMAGFLFLDPSLRKSATEQMRKGGEARRIVRLGLPLAAMAGLRMGFLAIIAGMMGRIGKDALAANQIALSIGLLAHTMPLGFGWAVGIRVAGRAKSDRLASRSTLVLGYGIGGGIAALAAVAYLAAGPLIASRYSADPAVIADTARILRSWSAMQVALALASMGSSALFGLLDVKFVTFANVIALYAIALPVGWLLGIHLGLGPAAVWAGPVLAQVALMTVFFRRFWRLSGEPVLDSAAAEPARG